jgi:hypothetical protein
MYLCRDAQKQCDKIESVLLKGPILTCDLSGSKKKNYITGISFALGEWGPLSWFAWTAKILADWFSQYNCFETKAY